MASKGLKMTGFFSPVTATAPLTISDVLKWEANPWYCREQVTLHSTADTVVTVGEVLGKITSSGKYVPLNLSASDGSQHAAGVALENRVALSQDVFLLALVRGPAVVLSVANGGSTAVGGLIWPSDADANDIAAGLVELAALNIIGRDS
jgi:hypothetical protein